MADRPVDSPSRAKQHVLRHLDQGSTGCLHARVGGASLGLYVMLGEILAVHASDDRDRLLRLLASNGAISPDRIERLRRDITEGRSLTEALFDLMPEELLQDLLQERFRENLFLFLQSTGTASFEPMESVFVENIQVGHDSRALVEELDQLVLKTTRLRQPPGLVLAPGAGTMKQADHLKIASICHPRLPLADLLQRSPWEAGRTLACVAEMLERGSLVVVANQSSSELDTTAGRPRSTVTRTTIPPTTSRSDQGASGASRPEPPRRDAVAAALASAVSAAVAKVGRQKTEGSPNAATPAWPTERNEAQAWGARPESKAPTPFSAESPTLPPTPVPAVVASRPPEPGVKPAPSKAPLPPLPDDPTEEADDDMAAFGDYDTSRAGGDFSADTHLLDRVELVPVDLLAPPAPRTPLTEIAPPAGAKEILIEMEDAENATKADLAAAVSLNFAGPKLGDDEARAKLEVLNEVLGELVAALDAQHGVGLGQSRAQLLVEGTPGAFAALFKGVEVDNHGLVPVEGVLKNLRRRPPSEHRRLLNRGLSDLIERALSLASEELEDKGLDTMLEKIAGYQQRLGM